MALELVYRDSELGAPTRGSWDLLWTFGPITKSSLGLGVVGFRIRLVKDC